MRNHMTDTQTGSISYTEIVHALSQGTEQLLQELKSVPRIHLQSYYVELENIQQFLETLSFIQDTMAKERLQDTLHNTLHSLRQSVKNIPADILTHLHDVKLDSEHGIPEFLIKATHQLGPFLRFGKNEMTAWMRLNSNDAPFYTPEIVKTCLQNHGITHGILEEEIQNLFANQTFDEEVRIAKGTSPQKGENGRIEFTVDVDDLSQKPKELSDHKVSFKDIKLYEFIAKGDVLANKIPPKPGKPGFTVTNRKIPPLKAQEAFFPELLHTTLSEDGRQLLVTEDCCIKKQNTILHLEPSLRVAESVSYKTGNVSSKVAVVVAKDVLSNFTLKSEKSIQVGGIVEGAHLEAKEHIIIRGGIQGKEKAVIESNRDITAKFISNATTNSLGNTVVESEIVNSTVWAAGQVFVTGYPGNIVGGEIHADSDIVANSIGSELGIKTVIRIGERAREIAKMIEETQEKINEQEDAVDKCNRIIEMLNMRESQTPVPDKEIARSKQQAEDMAEKAKQNLDELLIENENLQKQYEDSIHQSRTVRARENIFPGAIVQIQEAELTIKDPTGPVMFMKQGDSIAQLPYQPIKAESAG